ncbi:Small ubiquitin-related modifier 2 [Galdieria sulphuraria]|nr:Small ubiquitin-related modifier 2 [Galdieria sulphuraria]
MQCARTSNSLFSLGKEEKRDMMEGLKAEPSTAMSGSLEPSDESKLQITVRDGEGGQMTFRVLHMVHTVLRWMVNVSTKTIQQKPCKWKTVTVLTPFYINKEERDVRVNKVVLNSLLENTTSDAIATFLLL